jgi:hypothetical protein
MTKQRLGTTCLIGIGVLALWSVSLAPAAEGDKIKVLIIEGQNYHDWRSTTSFMKKGLEDSGRFVVEVATVPPAMTPHSLPRLPAEPKDASDAALASYKEALLKYGDVELPKYKEALANYADAYVAYRKYSPKFNPDFSKYEVVLNNYAGAPWPEAVNQSFEASLKAGKLGLVIVHGANIAFDHWKAYNEMIGMGWRDRNFGERLYLDDSGREVRVPKGQGSTSWHNYIGEFQVVVRDPEHPITKGMPREWLHAADELYDNLRGPIQDVRVLASAYSKGTKVHEPIIWTVTYGKGRVFHTPMGHDVNAMRCIGFLTTLRRGTEWAATGKVTLPIPESFPLPDKTSSLPAMK